MKSVRRKLFLGILALAVLWILFIPILARYKTHSPVAIADLRDGRIVQVEAITFGTEHQIGQKSPIPKLLRNWLSFEIRQAYEPHFPFGVIKLDAPGTIIWINAVDLATKAQVKCQDISIQIVDGEGVLHESDARHSYESPKFWRTGFAFKPVPGKTLNLKIESSGSGRTAAISIPNR